MTQIFVEIIGAHWSAGGNPRVLTYIVFVEFEFINWVIYKCRIDTYILNHLSNFNWREESFSLSPFVTSIGEKNLSRCCFSLSPFEDCGNDEGTIRWVQTNFEGCYNSLLVSLGPFGQYNTEQIP